MKAIAILLSCLLTQCCFSQQQKTVVYFDYDRSSITSASVKTLDSIAALGNDINAIELSGHCDSIGSNDYNDQLSMRRVAAVKDYLSGKNISTRLFQANEGFGKRQPVNDNATAADRSFNRRVEISYSLKQPVTDTRIIDTTMKQLVTKLETKITDTTVKEGDNIALENLQFIGGRHILLPSSKPVLEELLAILQKYPGLSIGLEGHICCTYNMPDGLDWDTKTNNLSVNRAKYVYDYLVQQGINKDRLSYKGFGNRKPLVYPERTSGDETLNRRVEIKIVRKNL